MDLGQVRGRPPLQVERHGKKGSNGATMATGGKKQQFGKKCLWAQPAHQSHPGHPHDEISGALAPVIKFDTEEDDATVIVDVLSVWLHIHWPLLTHVKQLSLITTLANWSPLREPDSALHVIFWYRDSDWRTNQGVLGGHLAWMDLTIMGESALTRFHSPGCERSPCLNT